jgi:hypothetical protein
LLVVNDATADNGSDYAAVANGIFDLVITAPGTLAGTAGLRIRKSGTDYWQVWFNDAGAVLIQRFAGGVAQGSPVTLASGVITNGATRTLRVITSGTKIQAWTKDGINTCIKRGADQTDGVLDANTTIAPFMDASWESGGGSLGALQVRSKESAASALNLSALTDTFFFSGQ